MNALLRDAALLCTALGVVSTLAVLARLRDVRLAIAVLLEFLLAAGLLRLAADPTVQAVVTAAVVVGLRKLIGVGLRFGARPADHRMTNATP